MADVKYPQVHVQLTGKNGNVFVLMGACTEAAKAAGLSKEQIREFTDEVFVAESYDHALRIMMSYFDVG